MKEHFKLPEQDRERMTRAEMQSMQWMLNAISTICYAVDDLGKRLELIPSGKQRMHMLSGAARSIYYDLQGTVPERQCRQILNAAKDLEVRMVPKLTPAKVTITLDKDIAMELVNAAQIKCMDCLKENDEGRECKLCQLLEAVVPLTRYDSFYCPYSTASWEK